MGAETERLRRADLRLAPVAIACWSAAGLAVLHPTRAAAAAAAAWAVAVGLVVVAAFADRARARTARAAGRRPRASRPGAGRRPRGSRTGAAGALLLAAVASAFAAGVCSHVALAHPARAAAQALSTGGGRSVVVTATVTGSTARAATGGVRFDAVAGSVTIGRRTHPVDVPVTVQLAVALPVGLGDIVEVRGTARATEPGERSVFFVRGTPQSRIAAKATGPPAVAAALRAGLATATRGLPQPAAGLVAGLAVGDTTAVSAELDADMKASSLAHLTAVSGANCALVIGIAFGVAALCGARRGIRVGCALGVLGAFVLLVTPEPSVVRAGMMAAIAMLALLLGRTRLGLALLLLAVVASLLVDPWLAGEIGFALSVAATAALLVLARPIAAGLARFMPDVLALAISVPVAAQLACGPLLVLINPTVPALGVVANLLAAPAAPAGTVLGLLACVAQPIAMLQAGLSALSWVPAAWIAGTAHLVASLPGHALPWLTGAAGALALAALGAGIVWLAVPAAPGRIARRLRTAVAGGVAIALGVWGGTAALDGVAAPLTAPRDWSIALCDIGQGDAILLRSAGRIALIDTGPEDEALRKCLTRFGVSHIDLLVLTHYDHDHAGAADGLRGRVDVLLHGPVDKPSSAALLTRFRAGGAQVVDAAAGMSGPLGEATWRVLWPLAESKGYPPGNESCIVLDARGPGMPTGLYLCDTDAAVQGAILRTGALRPPYEIVKVAHHGSADQEPALYAQLHAPVALISVGAGNDYGHPRAPTLEFLAALGADIHRTDQEGTVAATQTASGVAVWHEHASGAAPTTPGR